MFKFDDVESLRTIAFFKDSSYRDSNGDIVKIIENNIYNQKNMEAMLKIISNKNKIMDDVFSIHKNNTINNVADWQTLYTRILSNALVCNKLDIAEAMMTIILEINKNSIDECEKKSKDVRYNEKEN
jgi:RNA binding exosome subunit